MVITIEPGILCVAHRRCLLTASVPHSDDFPAAFRGLSVRIEDDVLITDGAPVVLSAQAPKEVADIEAACSTRS